MGKVIEFKYPKSTIDNIGLTLVRGGTHFILSLPFEIKGKGITCFTDRDNEGWFKCMITLRAFNKLVKEYPIIEQAYDVNEDRELVDHLLERKKLV